jgi:hypothetical protein
LRGRHGQRIRHALPALYAAGSTGEGTFSPRKRSCPAAGEPPAKSGRSAMSRGLATPHRHAFGRPHADGARSS